MSRFSAFKDSVSEALEGFFDNDMLVVSVFVGLIVVGFSIGKIMSLSSKN